MDSSPLRKSGTEAKLEASRRNLLDTSRRNKLINYKSSRTAGVDISGEDPFEVFNSVVNQSRPMTFTGKPDPKPQPELSIPPAGQQPLNVNDYGDPASLQHLRDKAEEELNSYLGYQESPVNLSDQFLNTNETDARLKTRLLKTLRDARTIIEESGVNVLFLALGMLEWREHEDTNLVRRAPLILVPVALEQKHEKFKVRWDGGEIGSNLSLQSLVWQEFNLSFPDLPNGAELDVRAYFDQVAKAVETKPDWKVDARAVALGFFSYAKFLMYTDLDATQWPEGRSPIDHAILNALLETGFPNVESAVGEDEMIDARRPVNSCNEVTSIDGSQTLALMQAQQGNSMVIQGPPGTGKSQTITNLLADAIANGKRFLFVAEKLAALDVVARKMEEVGLRDACLELHSHKANKAAFYKELDRIFALGPPKVADLSSEMGRLDQQRTALNNYCESANRLFQGRGISPRSCMGRLIQLGPQSDGLEIPGFEMMKGWDQARFNENRQLAKELQSVVHADGCPIANPFYGSKLTLLLPGDRDRFITEVEATLLATSEARDLSTKLAQDLSVPPPQSLSEVSNLAKVAKRAAEAPPMDGVAVKLETWMTNEAQLRTMLSAGANLKAATEANPFNLKQEAWTSDISSAKGALSKSGGHWWSGLSGSVRSARAFVDALAETDMNSDPQRLEVLAAIESVQGFRATIHAGDSIATRLFGVQWQGEQSNWPALSQLLEWIVALHKSIDTGEIPRGLMDFLEGSQRAPDLPDRAQTVMNAAGEAARRLVGAVQTLAFDPEIARKTLTSFDEIQQTLHQWRQDPGKLQRLITFNNLQLTAAAAGAGLLAELGARWDGAGEHLVEAYDRCWYEGVLREGLPHRPELVGFDRARHESLVKDFRELDNLLLQHNRVRIQRIHADGVPARMEVGNLGWLNKELKKKRSQASIRQAMRVAGAAIQDIKPIFMMSSLSVAMYLPPDGPTFDVVIFDEASQVKPEDSFGAILRGKQVIVVGDSKQMPPTSFFDRLTSEVDEEDEETAAANVTRDLESILALMDARMPPRSAGKRDLRWHYRSKHHSLIEPANALSYDHRLFVFPDPVGPTERLGLRYHHNPATAYGRGGSRQNPLEAQDVVQAVQEHAREHPEQSLMVVAFSSAQQKAIQDELDRVTPADPDLLAFITRHPTERLDVKNLENVQGDERDVVFISVGYGKDDKGFAAMSFGPLLLDGGERRLNVLITRARLRCEVFTNLTAADIRVGESQSVGLRHLKTFLGYAETGQMDTPTPTGLEPMSPFEEVVLASLQGLGYSVDTQVGSAGFFIDLGVQDPHQAGAYILGIECDGAQYHSSKTARDRDKLRQAVLEDRGWKIHRIWSTDWYNDPKTALQRCVAAIESATVHVPEPQPGRGPPAQKVVVEREVKKPPVLQNLPRYEMATLSIPGGAQSLSFYSVSQIAELVKAVALIGGARSHR